MIDALQKIASVDECLGRACRIVLGHNFLSYNKALSDCEMASRREDHCLKFAEGLADIERAKDLLPPTRLESHSRNLRNAHKISQLRFRTSGFKNSPIPHFIELLNFGSLTLTSLHAYLFVYMFSNFM